MKLVSVPLIAAGLTELRHGRFSFYPAIVGVRHNEWILRRATWTDILVANAKTSEEVWIPRRLVGEVSSIEAPYRIVGLVKELEYREGMALPYRRSVIEMPRAVNDFSRSSLRPALYARPAGVVAIRAGNNGESRFWRVLRGSIAAGILVCLAVIFVVRDAHLGARFGWTSAPPRLPSLGPQDDYSSVVRKLGNPTSDRWATSASGSAVPFGGYRRLGYARKGLTVILTGTSPSDAHYSWTLDRDGRIIHSVNAVMDSVPAIR
jgi:hypothetical protein